MPAQERLQELELLGTEGEALQLWRVKHEVKALTVLREVELQKQRLVSSPVGLCLFLGGPPFNLKNV